MESLPLDFIEKYRQLLAGEAEDFFQALTEGQAQAAFRFNPLKANSQVVQSAYLKNQPSEKVPWAPYGYFGKVSGRSPIHEAGYVYSQEASAMHVVQALDPQPGDRVLDLCGAPGGKATDITSRLKGSGLLLANEIVGKRAKILSENIERWGGRNVLVSQASPKELAAYFPAYFDKIVVDAPCSGEGMFRKHAHASKEWSLDQVQVSCNRQQAILNEAVKMLKPGGRLVYSTCTFAPEENEAMVSWLVGQHGLTLQPLSQDYTDPGRNEWGTIQGLEACQRIWPHKQAGEGHFIACLEKPSFQSVERPTSSQKASYKPAPLSLTPDQKASWRAFQDQWRIDQVGNLTVTGNQVWLQPEGLPDLAGLKVLRPGLEIGRLKKKRFEPSHALVMALSDRDSYPAIDINQSQWQQFVRGETFTYQGADGFTVLKYLKMNVGLGRISHGQVKNFYPKGLRQQGYGSHHL